MALTSLPSDKPWQRQIRGHFVEAKRLLIHIAAIQADSEGKCGWPPVWEELLVRGVRVGKDQVQRLMQKHGIRARGKRKFVVTADSK